MIQKATAGCRYNKNIINLIEHNRKAWAYCVDIKNRLTILVSKQELKKTKNGEWNIILTRKNPVVHNWFPNFEELKIFGLESGGVQQPYIRNFNKNC